MSRISSHKLLFWSIIGQDFLLYIVLSRLDLTLPDSIRAASPNFNFGTLTKIIRIHILLRACFLNLWVVIQVTSSKGLHHCALS